jgi:hypothetical protein
MSEKAQRMGANLLRFVALRLLMGMGRSWLSKWKDRQTQTGHYPFFVHNRPSCSKL